MAEQQVERRLAAILAADLVGYSAMVGADEPGTLARVRALRADVIEPLAAAHEGRVFKTTGDGFLAAFASAVQALRCAIAIQDALRTWGDGLRLRIGVHQGEVVPEGDDLLGDGVIVAARLEPLAQPGGICISGRVREDAAGKMALEVDDLGTPELKNIAQSVRVFRVRLGAPEGPALALPDKPSLVVLPFQNMSGDPEQEYFADGIVEDITSALSRIRWLFVIARNSAFTYKGRAVDIRQVGRELGVRYVLEGSIRKAANRVRITGQLIEAATGHHLWADRFEGELTDIFDLQDRVTEGAVGAIEPNLQRAEIARANAKPTENLDAYDLYLRALPHVHASTRQGNDTAINLLHRALQLDDNYSLAKALLSFVYTRRMVLSHANPGDAAHAVELTEDSLVATRDDPNTLRLAGHALGYAGGDIDAALAAVDRAVALSPTSAQVLRSAGFVHNFAGHAIVAMDLFERALRLSPMDPEAMQFLTGLGQAYLQAGRNNEACETLLRAVRERENAATLRSLIVALVRLGMVEDARVAAKRLLRLAPEFCISTYRFGFRDAEFVTDQQNALRLAGIPE